MRIGIAQLNPTVGDLQGNLALAIDAYEQLAGQGADLVVYPELMLCGYPPRDLLIKERFLLDIRSSLNEFARQTGPVPALIGFPEEAPDHTAKAFNSAAWCIQGKAGQVFRKRLLPTYDVFDETRYFESGTLTNLLEYQGKRIAVTICEDVWNLSDQRYSSDPLEEIVDLEPDLLINLSASPWHLDKEEQRKDLLRKVVEKVQCPVSYINAVGGNDELIFDGHSMSIDRSGEVIAQSSSFRECLEVHDLGESPMPTNHEMEKMESLRQALVLGIQDYAGKSGFSKGLVGLSGGIDSAVTAALAVEALGPDQVIGISLPSSISSGHSKDDARELADNLGIEFQTLAIQSIVDAASEQLRPFFGDLPPDVTEENLQARSRGLLLMAVSNKFGALLLTTGNKSELAVGYCTLYGDMCGGLAVISDVPKTQVFSLARHINREKILIPINSIEKPPSAELRPDQKDSDSLPDYEILDAILEAYVERGQSISSLLSSGFDEETVRRVVRLVDLNEYKRNQAAPGLKTTPLAFGVGRRIPIVQKYPN
jgi:NAD+ synthase (glutamine-hydrolysing)